MAEQSPEKAPAVKYVVYAVCAFGAFIVIAIYLVSRASESTQQVIIPIIASGLCGGTLKLINILQNRATDRKVSEDVNATRDVQDKVGAVHTLVNGGLHDRIKNAVREVLAEQKPPEQKK